MVGLALLTKNYVRIRIGEAGTRIQNRATLSAIMKTVGLILLTVSLAGTISNVYGGNLLGNVSASGSGGPAAYHCLDNFYLFCWSPTANAGYQESASFLNIVNGTQQWGYQAGTCTITPQAGDAQHSCSSTFVSPFPAGPSIVLKGSAFFTGIEALGQDFPGPLNSPFLNTPTATTWTNMPAAETELFGNNLNELVQNPTFEYKVRLGVDCSTGSNGATPNLNGEWSTDQATWHSLGVNVTIDSFSCPGTLVSPFVFTPAGFQNQVTTIYLRIVGTGGGGVGDSPSFTHIYLEWQSSLALGASGPELSISRTQISCNAVFNKVLSNNENSFTCNWQAWVAALNGEWIYMSNGPTTCEIYANLCSTGVGGNTWNDTYHRISLDLTRFSHVRLYSDVIKVASGAASIWLQYSLNNGGSWTDLCGASSQAPTNAVTSLGFVNGSSCMIDVAARNTNVLLRIVGRSNTIAQRPAWTLIGAEFSS